MKNNNYITEIIENALDYQSKLVDKALLFVYKNKTGVTFIEAKFKKDNFKHLTGVQTNLKPEEFFDNCVNKKLSPSSYQATSNTPVKLSVLPTIMNLPVLSATIGEYNNSRPNICVDIIIAKYQSVLGLTNNGRKYYYPKTILKINNLTSIMKNQNPILLTYIKNIDSIKTDYKISFINKKYDMNVIAKELPEELFKIYQQSLP